MVRCANATQALALIESPISWIAGTEQPLQHTLSLMQDSHQHTEVKSTDVIKDWDKWDALQGSHAVLDRSLPIRLCRPHGQLWPATCIICQLPQKGNLLHICTKPAPPKGQLAFIAQMLHQQSPVANILHQRPADMTCQC